MSSLENQGFTDSYAKLALIIVREANSYDVDWDKVASLYGYAKVSVCKSKWSGAKAAARKNIEKGITEHEGFTPAYAKLALMIARESNGYDVNWDKVASLYGYAKTSVCKSKWSGARTAARCAVSAEQSDGDAKSSPRRTKKAKGGAKQAQTDGQSEEAKSDEEEQQTQANSESQVEKSDNDDQSTGARPAPETDMADELASPVEPKTPRKRRATSVLRDETPRSKARTTTSNTILIDDEDDLMYETPQSKMHKSPGHAAPTDEQINLIDELAGDGGFSFASSDWI